MPAEPNVQAEPHTPSPAIRRYVGFLRRRAGALLWLALLLTALSLWLASRLSIEQDLSRLLPDGASSVVALGAAEERMGNQTDLLVEVRSPSRDANIRFGQALAERLRGRDDLRWVIFRQDPAFFEEHALLYLGMGDLLDLRDRVIERIREEVRSDLALELDEDVLDHPPGDDGREDLDLRVDELRARYGLEERLPEYLEADEGRVMMLRARPTRGTTDVEFTRALLQEVRGDVAALEPSSFHPELTATFRGAYANRAEEVRTIAGDAGRGTAAAAAVLVLCLLLYFRRVRAVPLVMLPLVASVLATLAYAELRYGYLNLVSAFIFAVLLGIGIDFGVHVLGRYEHERRRGRPMDEALGLALSRTAVSTLAAGLGTAGVYGALMVADFQGFAQFGELAAVGILLAVAGVWTLLPAAIVVLERHAPWRPPRVPRLVPSIPPLPRRGTVALTIAVLALAAGATVWASTRVDEVRFEYDFAALGPRPAGDREGPEDDRWKDAIGRVHTLAPVVALTGDRGQTEWVHRTLSAAKDLTPADVERLRSGDVPASPPGRPLVEPPPRSERPEDEWFTRLRDRAARHGDRGCGLARLATYEPERVEVMHRTLAQVLSIYTFVPEHQPEKLAIIRDVRRRIEQKRAALSEETRERLEEARRQLAVDAPVTVDALPEWVKAQLTDARGHVGRFVVFRNHGSKADYEVSKELMGAFHVLPTPSGPVTTAGNLYVMPQMLDTVKADAPWVLGLSVAVVLLTAMLFLRTLPGLLAVVGSVGLAILWLLGLMPLLGWKANLFNLVTFPLLLGMGQDDTLHIWHRYREEGRAGLGRVVRETGGAVFMTTLTTVVGFAGILFANHRGLLSFGWTAVVGMVLCWLASAVMLPALLNLGGLVGGRARPGARLPDAEPPARRRGEDEVAQEA